MGFRTPNGSTTADGGNRIMASVQPDAWHYGKWRAQSCSGELSEIADSKPKANKLAWQMAHDALQARRRRLQREAKRAA